MYLFEDVLQVEHTSIPHVHILKGTFEIIYAAGHVGNIISALSLHIMHHI